MYEQFDMGAHYVRSPFWQAAREMQLALNQRSPAGAFIWTNVNELDMARRRIPASLEARLEANDLLLEEIRITDPEVVLFFTGPRYDDRLRTLFRGVKLTPLPGVGLEHVSRVEHERLPKRFTATEN